MEKYIKYFRFLYNSTNIPHTTAKPVIYPPSVRLERKKKSAKKTQQSRLFEHCFIRIFRGTASYVLRITIWGELFTSPVYSYCPRPASRPCQYRIEEIKAPSACPSVQLMVQREKGSLDICRVAVATQRRCWSNIPLCHKHKADDLLAFYHASLAQGLARSWTIPKHKNFSQNHFFTKRKLLFFFIYFCSIYFHELHYYYFV